MNIFSIILFLTCVMLIQRRCLSVNILMKKKLLFFSEKKQDRSRNLCGPAPGSWALGRRAVGREGQPWWLTICREETWTGSTSVTCTWTSIFCRPTRRNWKMPCSEKPAKRSERRRRVGCCLSAKGFQRHANAGSKVWRTRRKTISVCIFDVLTIPAFIFFFLNNFFLRKNVIFILYWKIMLINNA